MSDAKTLRVAELWRYPVKSLAGERLSRARVTPNGIDGDRVVHVRDGRRVLTARTHPKLLGLSAALGDDGEPLIDGRPWADPASRAAVEEAAGPGAELVRYDGVGRQRFDVLPLSILT
ncbi:MAG TPA: MOSC N-terminal beta barrel domain-containing protein, partial [Candidatus Binatia bacterium]|nr:MOSC N-terminal beta barrel domain-containing protein [Candidatus Binatia bacterium]